MQIFNLESEFVDGPKVETKFLLSFISFLGYALKSCRPPLWHKIPITSEWVRELFSPMKIISLLWKCVRFEHLIIQQSVLIFSTNCPVYRHWFVAITYLSNSSNVCLQFLLFCAFSAFHDFTTFLRKNRQVTWRGKFYIGTKWKQAARAQLYEHEKVCKTFFAMHVSHALAVDFDVDVCQELRNHRSIFEKINYFLISKKNWSIEKWCIWKHFLIKHFLKKGEKSFKMYRFRRMSPEKTKKLKWEKRTVQCMKKNQNEQRKKFCQRKKNGERRQHKNME